MPPTDPHDSPTSRLPGAVPASSIPRDDLRSQGGPRQEDLPGGDAPAGGAGTPPPLGGPRPRRLTRSREDRLLGGVAGGLGRYFGVDPVIWRIVFAVLVFAGGAGFFAYAAAWLFVPADGARARMSGARVGKALLVLTIIGLALGGAGAVFLAAVFLAREWLAVALILVGAAMLFGGVTGRIRARWLTIPALAIAVPLTLAAAADIDADGGIGDREFRPSSVTELRDGYELGMGELLLDLRDVRLPAGSTELEIDVGLGAALVRVPDGVCVDSRVRVGAGAADVLGRDSSGLDVDVDWPAGTGASTPRLVIDADIGAGELVVRRGGQRFWRDDDDGNPPWAREGGPPWARDARGGLDADDPVTETDMCGEAA